MIRRPSVVAGRSYVVALGVGRRFRVHHTRGALRWACVGPRALEPGHFWMGELRERNVTLLNRIRNALYVWRFRRRLHPSIIHAAAHRVVSRAWLKRRMRLLRGSSLTYERVATLLSVFGSALESSRPMLIRLTFALLPAEQPVAKLMRANLLRYLVDRITAAQQA